VQSRAEQTLAESVLRHRRRRRRLLIRRQQADVLTEHL